MIKDSGERREFETGAVRDIADGKGRCDLLPLGIVARLLSAERVLNNATELYWLNSFLESGSTTYVLNAIADFCRRRGWDAYTAMLEVSIHYEEGAKKYSERNWQKGIPAHCFLDSGIRHFLKWMRGDTDEAHDRAFIWNMLGLIWTIENRPELNDLPEKVVE